MKTLKKNLGALLLAALFGCASEVQGTQLLVEIEASPSVAASLKQVRVFVYPLDASDESKPVEQRPITVTRLTPRESGLLFLESFGVAKGAAERFKLVIKGYDSSDSAAPALIEQKAIASFRDGQKLTIKMALLDACFRRATECSGLQQTCAATGQTAGQCVAVPEAQRVVTTPTNDLDAGVTTPDAGVVMQDGGVVPPTPPGTSRVHTIALGPQYASACAVLRDTTVKCWGDVEQIATSSTSPPSVVPKLSGIVEIAARGDVYFGRKSDGTVVYWDAAYIEPLQPTNDATPPTSETSLTKVVEIVAADEHACARTSEGRVSCWEVEPLLVPEGEDPTIPKVVPSLTDVTQLTAGGYQTCALRKDGSVVCWQTVEGSIRTDGGYLTLPRTSPTIVQNLDSVAEISRGDEHTCARKTDGTVVCWGDTMAGQFGDRTKPASPITTVPGLTGVVGIASGTFFTCAYKGDGSVLCWDAARERSTDVPVAVPGLISGVSELAAGGDFACVRQRDGQVMCWKGGNTDDPEAPELVPGL